MASTSASPSTVDQRRVEIGKTAASLLLRLIREDGAKEPESILIEPDLIVRASSLRSPVEFAPVVPEMDIQAP